MARQPAPLRLAHSGSLNIQGWKEALLARPDVVQPPEHVYICIYIHTAQEHVTSTETFKERKLPPKMAAGSEEDNGGQMFEHLQLFMLLSVRLAVPDAAHSFGPRTPPL